MPRCNNTSRSWNAYYVPITMVGTLQAFSFLTRNVKCVSSVCFKPILTGRQRPYISCPKAQNIKWVSFKGILQTPFYPIFPECLRHILRRNKIFSHIHILRPLVSSLLLIRDWKIYHSFKGLDSWFVNDTEGRRILTITASKKWKVVLM